MTDKPKCATCGRSEDVVLVWEDADDWTGGKDPDLVACESCGVVIR